jgi:predicted transcriptional regulator
VLDLLASHGGGTATTLAAELPVSRIAVIKHLAVLDRAGLVESPHLDKRPLKGPGTFI